MNAPADPSLRQPALRRLGSLAHQARASLRAADRFVTQGSTEDQDTASWLVCTAVELAREVADELDGLAKGLRDAGNEGLRQQVLDPLRKLAHQLHAASRAADVYLEQESRDDQDTGNWLVASALALAHRLAGALDDGVGKLSAMEPSKRLAPAAARAAAG